MENIIESQANITSPRKMGIVYYPSEGLKVTCGSVETFDAALCELVERMFATMYTSRGVGLAAPQVGVRQRVLVFDTEQFEHGSPNGVALINPIITWRDKESISNIEGCLSIPGVFEAMSRSAAIRVTYRDVAGAEQQAYFAGYQAVVVQHEIDHLDGVTMLDRMSPMKRKLALRNFVPAERLSL
jgi:peptide deformylase